MPANPEEMMALADKLAQAADGEEVMSLLREAGYELTATEEAAEEPLTMDMEEGAEEEGEMVEAAEAGEDMMEDMLESMPVPAPKEDGPKLNIVAARFRAADNALKKDKKANERR